MAVSNRTRQKWAASRRDPNFQKQVAELVDAQRADPFSYSALPYWLGLEVWTRDEGLYVLAGVEPGTVSYEDDDSLRFLTYPEGPWVNAMPFSEQIAFYQLPDPPGLTLEYFDGNAETYDHYIQHQEDRHSKLEHHRKFFDLLRHKLDHSPSALGDTLAGNGWPPIRFLTWANTIKFQPDWLEWAGSRGLMPDGLQPMAAPFFDADSPEYPELLAIAVRAWDHARSASGGTPKQRIEKFLAEKYPHLAASARAMIAAIANWKKAGGRPRTVK